MGKTNSIARSIGRSIAVSVDTKRTESSTPGAASAGSDHLLESGSHLLLESGDLHLLENG